MKKRGRPGKSILDLSEKQREILLSPLTCRAKAVKLNMSVGWVVKWEKRLLEELGSEKRGRPGRSILDLSEKWEILLSPMTCRAKADKLNMSVGWVVKWEKRLLEEMGKVFAIMRAGIHERN